MGGIKLMLGNEAIARGVVESGCSVATSYPGTPASEILGSVASQGRGEGLAMHAQWAVNEKVAFEIAYAAAMSGLRAMVSMKQVGLNVASDPLMSAAYMGTRGGFVVISADDPGPHSSQTEQDSRMMAMMAKIPVLDPDTPRQARELVKTAFALSERFEIPVMLRPTTRVCHARQDVPLGPVDRELRRPAFEKDPTRWAATPKFRLRLHQELEGKLARLAEAPETFPKLQNGAAGKRAVAASGVAAAHAQDILKDLGLWDELPFYQIFQPFPLHTRFIGEVLSRHESVLVLEETLGVIEMQLADRSRVRGKMDGTVSRVGELDPERIEDLIARFAERSRTSVPVATPPGRRPTLCAGCPHRATFFAIKKAAPRAIYTSDIGCYTLGLNLGAVDTVLCMGAAVSQAAGFYHAYKGEARPPDIIATIGDSTFFHAGIPALVDAVTQRVRFVLVVLDNRTTAMTGNQPTPASGVDVAGEPLHAVELESIIRGCGIGFVREGDPYRLKDMTRLIRDAVRYSREKGPAVVISRHPCLLDKRSRERARVALPPRVTEKCDGCRYCVDHFECPALVPDPAGTRVDIDPALCSGCGVCIDVCPRNAIVSGAGSTKTGNPGPEQEAP
ncbi:MAG: indolepyruvate ferredoxin oxidoreductase subunit alpha [Desulfobacterales bacterium]